MVDEKVKEIIAKQLGVNASEVVPDASFVEDLERIHLIPSNWSWLSKRLSTSKFPMKMRRR